MRRIVNTRKHNLEVTVSVTREGKDGTTRRERTRVVLRPGRNDLDDDKAKVLLANQHAETWHRIGWIAVEREKAPEKGGKSLREELAEPTGDAEPGAKEAGGGKGGRGGKGGKGARSAEAQAPKSTEDGVTTLSDEPGKP
ncbi:MAG: hypothetical protein GWN84_20495 [Gammaproteobacteria bacterium]|nr:hypothetical protein [Gammaproteobacteria bacterium]NIR85141.1 hypothetical protein [Gammaproteobacteria bacterium]NIU06190.1 hypothetical protein [Gammaproteobacteria bacterium]NIX87463.1 hypothetical protein [Gammaproteobacteria bacterium]